MMVEAEMPDGTVLEFPQGTDQAVIDKAAKDYIASMPKPQSMASGLVDSITKGATFGLAPKITALEAGVLGRTPEGGWFDYSKSFGDRYSDALEAERAQNQQFERQNPVASTVAEIGGGIASGSGLLRGGITAGRLLDQGTRLGRVAAPAIDSAAMGASYAYGGDQDILEGAAFGAGAGVAGKFAGDAIGSGYNKVRDIVAMRTGRPENQALARANAALRESGMDQAQLAARMKELGPQATALDALGTAGGSLGRSAANVSPQARGMFQEFNDARMAAQPERLMSAVDRASGNIGRKSVDEVIDATRSARKPAIDAAYEAARQEGFRLPRGPIQPLQKLAPVRNAMRAAWKTRPIQKFLSGQKRVSKLDFYDAVKKELDARATALAANDKNKFQAGQMRDLARTWRETVDSMLPGDEYVDARGLAQKLFQDIEAIEMGAEAASGRRGLDIARKLQSLPPERVPYARQGWGARKAEDIFQNKGTPGKPDQYFEKPSDKAVIEALLTPAQQKALKRTIDAERQFGRTAQEVLGNSSTARQLAEMGAVGAGAGFGSWALGADPTTAGMTGLGAALLRKGTGAAFNKLASGNEQKVAPLVMQALLKSGIPPAQYKRMPPEAQAAIARALGIGGVALTAQ